MDLHALNISAGKLAGEGMAGLVEEDGDELEGREQESPPQGEDDDGGDAYGGDEDHLVVAAAALQLPVHVHHRRSSPAPARRRSGSDPRTPAEKLGTSRDRKTRGKWQLFELAESLKRASTETEYREEIGRAHV